MTQTLSDAREEARRFGTSFIFELERGLPDIPEFRELLTLYGGKWDGSILPAKDDFRFQELRGWHANFALIELDPDLKDGTCRIMGHTFSSLFGGALEQGMRLSDARTDRIPVLLHYFDQLLNLPAIGLFKGRLGYEGREHVSLELLDVPATNRHGEARYILSFAQEN